MIQYGLFHTNLPVVFILEPVIRGQMMNTVKILQLCLTLRKPSPLLH